MHEAYIRLVGGNDQRWDSRGHFFAAAAEAMRRILVEQARRKKSHKRGMGMRRVDLNDAEVILHEPPDDLLALDDSLAKLAGENQKAADLVKLRLFAGLTVGEAAASLGVSRRTGFRHWAYARAFLQLEMQGRDQ